MGRTMISASSRESTRFFNVFFVFIFLLLYTHFAIAADSILDETGFS